MDEGDVMVDIYTPKVTTAVRPAGQVSTQRGSAMRRAGAAAQGVADKFTEYYEQKAGEEAELIWTQAQVDWARDFKERAKTAGDGFTRDTMEEYDVYVGEVMKSAPPRRADEMDHAFAKYRIGLEAKSLEVEAAARARARAERQAKITANRHNLAMEMMDAGLDPAAVMNCLRYNSSGELLDDKSQRSLLAVVTEYAITSGDREAMSNIMEDLVDDDRYNDILTAEQNIALRNDLKAKKSSVDYVAREDAKDDLEAFVVALENNEESPIDVPAALAELTVPQQAAWIDKIDIASNVGDITADVETKPEGELSAIFAGVQPSGAETEVETAIRTQVEAKIDEVRTERRKRPAVAALNDPEVSEAWEQLRANPKSVEAAENYIRVSSRYQTRNFNLSPGSVQAVPEPIAAELADSVRKKLADLPTGVTKEDRAARNTAVKLIYQQAQNLFGEYADEVLIQSLKMMSGAKEDGSTVNQIIKEMTVINTGRKPMFLRDASSTTTPEEVGPVSFSDLDDEGKTEMVNRYNNIVSWMQPEQREQFIDNLTDPALQAFLRARSE